MSTMPLKEIIDAALSKIGSVADVNTVIGDPITLPGNVTVIPFSKVSVGFASGGSEFGGKKEKPDGSAYFAGGNGAGVSVTPLGFIAVEDGKVRLINLAEPSSYSSPQDPVNKTLDGINGVIDKAPEIIDKVKDFISDRKKKKSEDITAEELEEVEEEIRNG
ncbi:MAG: sporulation protein YtfJ [Clostridia bacterium]|nr:sporulation protein YtfJ [Clostridia bacterium]